jgi:hypothetical protein
MEITPEVSLADFFFGDATALPVVFLVGIEFIQSFAGNGCTAFLSVYRDT